MKPTLSLEQLAERLTSLEKEVKTIRKELADLRQQTGTIPQVTETQAAGTCPRADKGAQRHWFNGLFAALSIKGIPIGVEALQQRMGQAGLAPNELSRSLIEAREE
jgi:hypothetical protein